MKSIPQDHCPCWAKDTDTHVCEKYDGESKVLIGPLDEDCCHVECGEGYHCQMHCPHNEQYDPDRRRFLDVNPTRRMGLFASNGEEIARLNLPPLRSGDTLSITTTMTGADSD